MIKLYKEEKTMFLKKFRVEFNNTGYYSGAGIWDTVDEISAIPADSEEEAVEFAKEWWIDFSFDCEQAKKETSEYAWRASEIKYDEDGYLLPYEWKNI